ncbi:MAG: OmpA family protein [Opitutaceae bacterium]
MKSLLRLTALLVAASALVLAGCSKKPQRPNPSQTIMGPGSGAGLNPVAVDGMGTDLFGDAGTALESRDPGAFGEGNQLRNVLEPVYFDFDSAAIRVAERGKLAEAKDYLEANSGARLLLEGHCDWRGTTEYNMGLGDRRAAAVRDFLATLGISADRVETLSKGDLEAAESASDSQAQQDRRVELVVLR